MHSKLFKVIPSRSGCKKKLYITNLFLDNLLLSSSLLNIAYFKLGHLNFLFILLISRFNNLFFLFNVNDMFLLNKLIESFSDMNNSYLLTCEIIPYRNN